MLTFLAETIWIPRIAFLAGANSAVVLDRAEGIHPAGSVQARVLAFLCYAC